jgi:hypothetical protein
MAYAIADTTQIQDATVQTVDEHGQFIDVSGVVIPVIIPADVVAELLAAYDPASSTSPTVAYSRPMARVLLDALRMYRGV